ncbi:hypothetical protein ACXX82_24250 [Glaciimonas sp. GNP009]
MTVNRKHRVRTPIEDVTLAGFYSPPAKPNINGVSAPEKIDRNVLENRLYNWGETVSYRGSTSGGVCAAWAKEYVRVRGKQEAMLAIALKIARPNAQMTRGDVNELDGWLIELAVRELRYLDQRHVLKYKYVWRYPNHFIKNKLHINDSTMCTLSKMALDNLQKILDKFDAPDNIRSTNCTHGEFRA